MTTNYPDNSGLIVDALKRTDPSLAAAIDVNNSWQNAIKKRGARVNLYRKYERGDHRADMLEEIRKMLRLPNDDTGLTELNVNYCKIIIDKFTSRLFVQILPLKMKIRPQKTGCLLLLTIRISMPNRVSGIVVQPGTGMLLCW